MQHAISNKQINQYNQAIAHLPLTYAVLDAKHRFIAATQQVIVLLGMDNIDHLYGKKNDDVPCASAQFAETWEAQNTIVLKNKIQQKFLTICGPYADNKYHCFLVDKTPLFDTESNAQQVALNAIDIPHEIEASLGTRLVESTAFYNGHSICHNYQICHNVAELPYTTRELECIFYILRGYSAKQIGGALRLSFRTVENHIANIKQKMGVCHRSQLIEKALQQGLLYFIPATLCPYQ